MPMLRADVLIDDRPENCVAWLKANPGGRAFMPERPWNECWAFPRMPLGEIVSEILSRP